MSVTDGEAALREAGATDVLREEPLAAINGLHEGSFDVVIDAIGGRRRASSLSLSLFIFFLSPWLLAPYLVS